MSSENNSPPSAPGSLPPITIDLRLPRRKRAFISHASEDHAIAADICARLEEVSISCWIAPRDIAPGRSWAECIMEAIETCPFCVLLLSDEANDSSHVMSEVERARDKGATLVPVKMPDVEPSAALEYLVSSTQWIEISNPPTPEEIQQLAHSLVEHEVMEVARIMTAKKSVRPSDSQTDRPVGRLKLKLKGIGAPLRGKTRGRFKSGQKLVIGRSLDADVCMQDEQASRHHACLSVKDDDGKPGLWLLDMQSTNGTQLNGVSISQSLVKNGDVIQIGNTEIRVSVR